MDGIVDRFAAERPRLVALAARVLGSATEAEDVVQHAWLRLASSEPEGIDNLGGWLTTVVARAALDRLRQRRRRRENSLDNGEECRSEPPDNARNPEAEALFAEAVGLALLVVLDRLGPAERLAFVLHDLFGVAFEEIAPMVGRTPQAARQLASRARRRVRGGPEGRASDLEDHRNIIAAFAAASREGRIQDLLCLLDPDVRLTVDATLLPTGVPREVRGADQVAPRARMGAQRGGELMLVENAVGLVAASQGRVERVLTFQIQNGRITAIEVIADPARLRQLDLRLLDAPSPDRASTR
jgi:RNA polymerase sigma-70 factor (ECF subfamily)